MKTSLHALLVPILLSACAGAQQVRELPKAWAQSQSEVGELPVGRVVSVERMTFKQASQADNGAQAGMAATVGLLGAIAVTAAIDGLKNGDWYFRHGIQLKTSGEVVVRDEYAAFSIGDCVALRSQPMIVVPAFSGACER